MRSYYDGERMVYYRVIRKRRFWRVWVATAVTLAALTWVVTS